MSSASSPSVAPHPWPVDTGSLRSLEVIPAWLLSHSRRRAWPLALTVVMLVVGMVFMFEWNSVVHHEGSWATPGDMWNMLRGAHYVGWGYLGGIYTSGTGIITFPGLPILLAPVAILSGSLHLTESFLPYFLPRPTAALIVMPVEILLAATVVFASDALAERMGVPFRRRISLCVIVAGLAWPVAAVWGHAEDVLAMTFALYALMALLDSRWSAIGWLLGVGVVIQPLVALLVPLLIAAAPPTKRVALGVRSLALSVFLVGVAFAGNPGDTYRALVTQPTPPRVNHATPWVALAPKLATGGGAVRHVVTLVRRQGHPVLSTVAAPPPLQLVTGGPARAIDLVLVILVSVYVARHPQRVTMVLWLAAAVLASRCLFEAVMTPYYLAPPLVLALILVARQGARRFWPAVLLSLEVSVYAYHHLEPWVWWVPIVVGLAAVLALGYPGDLRPEATDGSLEATAVSDRRPGLDQVVGAVPASDCRLDRDEHAAFA